MIVTHLQIHRIHPHQIRILHPNSIYRILILITSTTEKTTTNSSNKKTDTTPVNDSVTVWRYTCSSSNSIYLESIEPKDPGLKQLSDEVDSLQSALDNTYVDEYSQSSVDSYNKKVNALNAKIESYKSKQTTYNIAVDKYNNYLERNCTKRY